MTITKIKQIAKTNRYHVYVDEKWYGIFLDETLASYKIKTGDDFDESALEKIKFENDKKLSFDMAVSYMEKYMVTEKGVKDYLRKKNFAEQTIKATVEKLHSYNLINDERFAEEYFSSMSKSQGKNTIINKLRQKGISKEIIDSLIENIDEDDQFENAIALAKKFVKNRDNSAKTKQKCLAHLVYKGYDYPVALRATKEAIDFENEGENDDWI